MNVVNSASRLAYYAERFTVVKVRISKSLKRILWLRRELARLSFLFIYFYLLIYRNIQLLYSLGIVFNFNITLAKTFLYVIILSFICNPF